VETAKPCLCCGELTVHANRVCGQCREKMLNEEEQMKTPIELLRELERGGERNDNEGYYECSHCPARGWGFIEHDKDCPVREARALLGKCPHGYSDGTDHGKGPCACEVAAVQAGHERLASAVNATGDELLAQALNLLEDACRTIGALEGRPELCELHEQLMLVIDTLKLVRDVREEQR